VEIKLLQYVITDGTRFIYKSHSGKFGPISSEAMTDVFTKKVRCFLKECKESRRG